MMIENKFTLWIKEQYSLDTLRNISQEGCISGIAAGLCYYSETAEVYKSFKEEIWEILRERTDDYGYDNVIKMVAEIAGNRYDLNESYTFENYLVWFAVEDVAYRLVQIEEEKEEEAEVETVEEEQSSVGISDTLYRHSIAQGINCGYMVYTAGVLDWAEKNKAHWLVDLIAITLLPAARKKLKDRFYTVMFTVTEPNEGTVIVTDGNSNEPLVMENLPYVDFSRKVNLKLFLSSTNDKDSEYCLMFPDEY